MPGSIRRLVQSLALCVACAGLVPASVYGQSLKEQLVGTWTLVSWTRVVGDVEEPALLGRDAVGQFMFAPDGHMCFNAMRRNRAQFGSRDFQGGTPEEKTAAYDSYTGYCGRYEVNEQERSVVFRLELSSYPNYTGTTMLPLNGVHVLLVDDDDATRSVLQDVLASAGARVTVASSAPMALEVLRHEIPTVLVSDIMMPNQDGYWLIQAVRKLAEDRGGRVPALAFTGDPVRHSRERALEAGYDAHAGKPIGLATFCRAILDMLRDGGARRCLGQ